MGAIIASIRKGRIRTAWIERVSLHETCRCPETLLQALGGSLHILIRCMIHDASFSFVSNRVAIISEITAMERGKESEKATRRAGTQALVGLQPV